MRIWTLEEWAGTPRAIPVGDWIIDATGVVFERCINDGGYSYWYRLADRIEDVTDPLDEYDFALLRYSFGLSEDVEL